MKLDITLVFGTNIAGASPAMPTIMIDELAVICSTCGKASFFVTYDSQTKSYFCPACVQSIGHELSFSKEENDSLAKVEQTVCAETVA